MQAKFPTQLNSTIALLSLLMLFGCSSQRRVGLSEDNPIILDTLERMLVISADKTPEASYHPAPDQLIDIHHVELDLSFDWTQQHVLGKERLTLSPYFYAIDTIKLDARGFVIHSVRLNGESANYLYEGLELVILPNRALTRKDTVQVSIDYTARPELLTTMDGTAISSDKGLYFIDPLNENPEKPQQLWTQGETESNSAWFALVDKPHEKFTQEVFLTVDTAFETLSNGRFMYSSENENGTRTDYWKQDLQHSGYLTMIAVGDFYIEKDSWKDLDVWYYVPKAYKNSAKAVFGNTPEMLEFYSNILDYPYPWEKYHQVVVEDFVSGAMENTSAVVHGSFVVQTKKELIDQNYEDVIAHELFHHWFGDIVTCETWAHITLNEGFATYGEYLWEEYKYGQKEADLSLDEDLLDYFDENESKSVPLIRYRYHLADDLFDSHSYQKGGRVIHMLRMELGDEAFFESLNKYLKHHEFQSVELDDFRLICEEVSGRDLKWFFDQWFYRESHPQINVSFQQDSNVLVVDLIQKTKPFSFHVPLSIVENGQHRSVDLWVNDSIEQYTIPLKGTLDWFGLNDDGGLLGEIRESKPDSIWEQQALSSDRYFGKDLAFRTLYKRSPSLANTLVDDFIQDPFWHHRLTAIYQLKPYELRTNETILNLVKERTRDSVSIIRHAALSMLDSVLNDSIYQPFELALKDSSYFVQFRGLDILSRRKPCAAVAFCDSVVKAGERRFNAWAARIFALCGDETHEQFYYDAMKDAREVEAMLIYGDMVDYAIQFNEPEILDRVAEKLYIETQEKRDWWTNYAAEQGLKKIRDFIEAKITNLERFENLNEVEREKLARWKNKRASLSALMDEIED